MIVLKDTTASQIASEILKARRNLGAASGLAFTLVVVTDTSHYDKVFDAAMEAGREHPSRILIVCRSRSKTTGLDAELHTDGDVPGDVVTLRMGGELDQHADSVVLPLLLPDSPVVAWWPNESPVDPGKDPIGILATRRITDAAGVANPVKALLVRAEHHSPGDTDLTWTRLTPWRALLAAALDQYHNRITGVTVEAATGNAPAQLMAAWLQDRLKVDVQVVKGEGAGITAVRLHSIAGDVVLAREPGSGMANYLIPGQPPRQVALPRRDINQLITEELRRMDPDDIFEQATRTMLARNKKGLVHVVPAHAHTDDIDAWTGKVVEHATSTDDPASAGAQVAAAKQAAEAARSLQGVDEKAKKAAGRKVTGKKAAGKTSTAKSSASKSSASKSSASKSAKPAKADSAS